MLDVERERLLGRMFGLSPCVGLLAYEYSPSGCWGFRNVRSTLDERCVALAREVGHPPSIGFALTARAASCYLHGDPKATVTAAEEALHFAREERLGFWEPMARCIADGDVSESGERAESIAQIRGAIERYRAAGNGVEQVWF